MVKFKFISFLSKKAVKHAPAICVGVGACGVAVGAGLIAKATYDNKEEIDECKNNIEVVKEWAKASEIEPKERKKEIALSYVKCAKSLTRIYLPGSTCMCAGLCSIVFGHKILSTRYAAVIAAYESVNKSYKNYRANIREKYGKDEDIETAYDLKAEKLNDETVYVPKDDIFIPDRDLSDFAVFFGKGYSVLLDNYPYSDNPYSPTEGQIAKEVARDIEKQANDMFNEFGYLFLDDVYSMLGLIDVKAPEGIGWVKGRGDDFISFGIFDVRNANVISSDEDILLLDFNHDGYILPYI